MSVQCFGQIFFAGLIVIEGGCNLMCVSGWFVSTVVALGIMKPAQEKVHDYDKSPTKVSLEKFWLSSLGQPAGMVGKDEKLLKLKKKAARFSNRMELWGPALWQALHNISIFYDRALFRFFRRVFEWLAFVLPCAICRIHVGRHIKMDKSALLTKQDFMNFVINLHNTVTISKYEPSVGIIYPRIKIGPLFIEEISFLEKLVAEHGRSKRM